MYLSLLNWFTFTWLLILTIMSVQRIVKGHRESVYWVIPVLFIFCGLPLLLDEIAGRLKYDYYPGFAIASADELTNIIYCLYVAVVPVILLWVGRPKINACCPIVTESISSRFEIESGQFNLKTSNRIILFAILMSPFIMVMFSPDPSQYLTFGSALFLSPDSEKFHAKLTALCNLAILAGCYLLAVSRPVVYGRWPNATTMITVVFWMLIAVWIHAKRNIVATLVVLLLLALHYRGILRGVRTYVLTGLGLIVLLSYSFFFQSHTRRVNTAWYENARIDFGRDHTIKMTIFAELHPETMKILEYRGQSLLFHLTVYVPRNLWPEKPLPYAQYFTSAMFLSEPRMWGWGMTTSCLEEAIANFSWLGMLMAPLFIGTLCRVGDASKSSFAHILTPLIANLFLLVQATAFEPLFLLLLICLVHDKWLRKYRVRWGLA